MPRFIGLDVHRRVVEACILDDAGHIVTRRRFDLDRIALDSFCRVQLEATDRVVLEATANTWAVARAVRPFVAAVIVGNPLQIKAIAAAKVKTDKVDAHVLAQLLRCDFLPTVWEPDEATQELRRLAGRRIALVSDRTRFRNRIHGVLIQRLILPPDRSVFSTKGLEWLRKLDLDPEGRAAIDSELRLLEAVDREIVALEAVLDQKAFADPRAKLLLTLPGVRVAAAVTVLAVLGDITRFRDADHAASYVGLTPTIRQSGNKCYHGHITKAGSSMGRHVLVQAAKTLHRHPGPLGAFYRRVAKRKSANIAATATARKLIVLAWHLLTSGQPYRYAAPETTEGKLRRLRVSATGKSRPPGFAEGTRNRSDPAVGGRRVRTLAEVYASEGLPAPPPRTEGEERAIDAAGVRDHIETIHCPKVRKLKTKPKTKSHE